MNQGYIRQNARMRVLPWNVLGLMTLDQLFVHYIEFVSIQLMVDQAMGLDFLLNPTMFKKLGVPGTLKFLKEVGLVDELLRRTNSRLYFSYRL